MGWRQGAVCQVIWEFFLNTWTWTFLLLPPPWILRHCVKKFPPGHDSLSFLVVKNQHYEILNMYILSVQFSRSVVSNSLWPHGLQYARLPCSSPTPGAHSNSCPLSRCCHPAISSSIVPFPLTFNLSQHQGLFQWVSFSHQVARVLAFQLWHQSFQSIFRTDFL